MWKSGLFFRSCDLIDVIFYILKLDNNFKIVLGGEKKVWVLKIEVGCIKNILIVLKGLFFIF